MLCDEVRDRLYEYIYDELEEEQKREVENHLNRCSSCRKAYDELKVLLIDDMEQFMETWEQIKMPVELPAKVKRKLNKGSFNLGSIARRAAIAAGIGAFMLYAVPVAAYYMVQNSPLSKYVDFDNTIIQQYEEGKGQLIGKSSNMKDINFTVDAIIRGKDKTTILFSVKSPKDEKVNYAMPAGIVNTITVEDQFGIRYNHKDSGMTLQSVNEDGEVKAIMNVEPLHFWAYKLKVRITAMETGKMTVEEEKGTADQASDKNLKYNIKKYKDIYGKWEVNFFINRSAETK